MEDEKEKVELTSEEKMKKKFGIYRKLMTVVESFLMVVPILVIISAIVIGLAIGLSGEDKESNILASAIDIKEGEEIDWRAEILDILDMKNDIEADKDYQAASETLKNLMAISGIIAGILGYILAIIVVDCLAKIFGEVEKEGTPFTENNIKLLKKVHIVSIFLWILGMAGVRKNTVGIVFVLVISAFRSVFEYGYKLQKEADETL